MDRKTEWIRGEAHLSGDMEMEPWELSRAYRAAVRRLALYEDSRIEPAQARMLGGLIQALDIPIVELARLVAEYKGGITRAG